MSNRYVVAIDAGSSSIRVVLVDERGESVSQVSAPMAQLRPRAGWVELDTERIWWSVLDCMHRAIDTAGIDWRDIAAVGVTSHRESCLLWRRSSGAPVHNAVMWMSTQTDDIIRGWSKRGLDPLVRERTGLRNDSFFSAGKVAWLLDNVPGARADAEAGRLAFGTIDSWLVWKLSGGRVHRTDASCASRTAMFDLATGAWSEELCAAYGVPMVLLPQIVPSGSVFTLVDEGILPGGVPVAAVLGDQQAGLYGQGCLTEGDVKNTYGTAGVLVVNTGTTPRLIDGTAACVAWGTAEQLIYETEGVVAHCGQALHWLRDQLGIDDADARSEQLARSVPDNGGVVFVPAFAGLWDPHSDREVRGAMFGLSVGTEQAHLVRAAVESMAYQTRDIVEALAAGGTLLPRLRVDGGAARNDFLCQFQADLLGIPVERPVGLERTALGVAQLAGETVGLWDAASGPAGSIRIERVFEPLMPSDEREELYADWRAALAAAQSLPRLRRRARTEPIAALGGRIEGSSHALTHH